MKRVPENYFLPIEDGIFEIRVEVGSNIFRVFHFFDEGQRVVLLNGFEKKTQNSPRDEILLAQKIKREYSDKKKGNNNLTSYRDHLDQQYGEEGMVARENYKHGFEAFKPGVFIQEMREKQNMTQ